MFHAVSGKIKTTKIIFKKNGFKHERAIHFTITYVNKHRLGKSCRGECSLKCICHITLYSHLVLPGDCGASGSAGLARLHLEHSAEQILRGGGEEADLSIGVEAVQVRAL